MTGSSVLLMRPIGIQSSILTGDYEVTMPVDLKTLHETLKRVDPDRADRAIGWLVLNRILEDRFGEVPQRISNRILAADIDVIKVWVKRALDAPNLRAVFGPD